jgi:hypothetical protein
MSPELEQRLKEQVATGTGYDAIETELLAEGYSKEAIALAYAKAKEGSSMASSSSLSSGTHLFKVGIRFAKTRTDLILLLAISALILNLSLRVSEEVESTVVIISAAAAGLMAFLVYLLGLLAAFYVVVKAEQETVSIKDAFRWSVQNIFTLGWLTLITFSIVWGGLQLFIIPGLILSVLMYFSQYAFVREDKRGLKAVLRSRQLVTGRTWAVFKRIFVLVFYTFIITIIISVPLMVLEELELELLPLAILLEGIVELVIAMVTVASIAAANQLYKELSVGTPAEDAKKSLSIKYTLLGLFGFVGFVGLIVLVSIFALWGATIEPIQGQQSSDKVRSEVVFTEPIAEGYFIERGTYEGVCDAITPAVTSADETECNDDATSWALTATIGADRWCTDIAGYGKLLSEPLSGRTQCLNLPTMDATEAEPSTDTSVSPDESTPATTFPVL